MKEENLTMGVYIHDAVHETKLFRDTKQAGLKSRRLVPPKGAVDSVENQNFLKL